ncbi:hypothetical protein D3C84_649500 [compost metagenome]
MRVTDCWDTSRLACICWVTWLVRLARLPSSPSISAVESAVRLARARTSSATTAKPRPCSPARAASIAAFSASRLVCSAIERMVPRIDWMSLLSRSSCCIDWADCSISWLRRSTLFTAASICC